MPDMTKEAALRFLADHAPMPDDPHLTDALIDEYDQVRRFFLAQRDPDCIRPLLQSFGRWGGRGVYQLVPDVLRPFTPDALRAPLLEALASPHESVRYWACQVAQEACLEETVPLLEACLVDRHVDIRMAAAAALGLLEDHDARASLERAIERAQSHDEAEFIREVLADLD